MSELLPCPFCGSEAEVICNDIGVFIGCFHEDCPIGPATSTYADGYSTEAEAIKAWNTRYHSAFEETVIKALKEIKDYRERTCQNVDDHKTVWFICSVCGYPQKLSHTRSYCPNCGAKVIA